ncbi:MAG: hypothetical protein KJO26_16710 [Deltaproteobacteria bacterium]|nr:hypothetical protein [Deltaproteobacteria bacterium]
MPALNIISDLIIVVLLTIVFLSIRNRFHTQNEQLSEYKDLLDSIKSFTDIFDIDKVKTFVDLREKSIKRESKNELDKAKNKIIAELNDKISDTENRIENITSIHISVIDVIFGIYQFVPRDQREDALNDLPYGVIKKALLDTKDNLPDRSVSPVLNALNALAYSELNKNNNPE